MHWAIRYGSKSNKRMYVYESIL